MNGADQVWVNGRPVRVPDGAARRGTGPRVIARLTGPITERHRTQLDAAGAAATFWCPPYGVCLTITDAGALAALPFVAGFVPYEEHHCDRGLSRPRTGPGTQWLDVTCFSRAERGTVEAALAERGVTILDAAHAKLRIAWPGDPRVVRDVVGVKLVERPRLPQLCRVGLAVDIDAATADGAWATAFDGTGEIVAVADTGLDTGDPSTITADVAGRLQAVLSWPINPSWAGFVTNPDADDGAADTSSGHGTFVAGVVLGDGAASGGLHRGVAPGARLVFQAIEQWVAVAPGHPDVGAPAFALAGRPADLRDLFTQAHDHGARLHVNAWGTAAHGAYDNDSYETDLFLHEHPDAVVLVAAGNAGSDADGNRRPDAGSLNSPATAKNVVTVGATEGSAMNGFPGNWASLQTEGRVFTNAADRADPVYGEPDRIAPLSSAGPTGDGRIKPDLCAPGTDIVGPRSSLATGRGWGLVAPSPHYMADGGTSVAVAVAGGCAAIVRQAWRTQRRGRAPAGSTVKALLVLGAAPVLARGSVELEDRFVAGFGRLDLTASLPQPGLSVLSNASASAALGTGGRRRYRLAVPGGGRLRAVLCWYDPPGERLINNLDLSLTGPGLAAPVWGNHLPGQPQAPGTADTVNPLEVIDLDGLPGGTYELTVIGANVPSGPQPFSVVTHIRAAS